MLSNVGDMLVNAKVYFRQYGDEGRLQQLLWFVIFSSGIAFLQWSLSPQVVHFWMPHELGSFISMQTYFNILFALTAAWAVTVCIGFFKCHWPALLMLTYSKWGVFAFYFWGSVYWACIHGDCI